MKPEEKARQHIDALLEAVCWSIQDMSQLNLGASLGVTVREFPLESGFADYLLFVDRKVMGVVEMAAEN
jgi:type I restriction enzyme R subunit